MQIRNRNGNIEFLRAKWDKDKKRTVQKLIKEAEFTEGEAKEFQNWSDLENIKKDQVVALQTAKSMSKVLRFMIAGLDQGQQPDSPEMIYDLIDKLQRSLRKRGVLRIKTEPVPKTAV